MTDDDIVNGWLLRYAAFEAEGNNSPRAKEHMDAMIELDNLCYKDPNRALDIIVKINQRTESDFVLDNLAAGPLETVLGHHGEKVIGRIEELAAEHERFRMLLRGVWKNLMSDGVWARVQAAIGAE